jgi:coenzyme PQQ biosynthesis protein PqqD
MRRPQLVRHARYRRDALRGQHQLVYPEGVLVLNESGAAIVQRCDGRPLEDVLAGLTAEFAGAPAQEEVVEFLERLAQKGLLRDAGDNA